MEGVGGIVFSSDVRLMSEYTRTLSAKGGPRKLLAAKGEKGVRG